MIVEIIGYIASAIVLISFLTKNIKRLRIINIVGCSVFIIYGIMLEPLSVPIILTNTSIVFINIYFLIKMKTRVE